MFGDLRLAEPESVPDLTHRTWSGAQQFDDAQPVGLGERGSLLDVGTTRSLVRVSLIPRSLGIMIAQINRVH